MPELSSSARVSPVLPSHAILEQEGAELENLDLLIARIAPFGLAVQLCDHSTVAQQQCNNI